jgi:hypothetical protein
MVGSEKAQWIPHCAFSGLRGPSVLLIHLENLFMPPRWAARLL